MKPFKKVTLRVPNELHKVSRIELFKKDTTFQAFFVEKLEELTSKGVA